MAAAEDEEAAVVLLGVVDQAITATDAAAVDCSTNKIGGAPDWIPRAKPTALPTCELCGKVLMLALQISAPLDEVARRNLYIFCCSNWGCTNKAGGWRALRCQAGPGGGDNAQAQQQAAQVEKACQELAAFAFDAADDWGDHSVKEDSTAADDLEQLLAIRDRAGQTPSAQAVSTSAPARRVDAHGQASAGSGSAASVAKAPTVEAQYPAHFLNVEEEPEGFQLGKHEQDLLRDYERSGGGGGGGGGGDGEWSEQYEPTRLGKSEKTFFRFLKRLERLPTQCLRYCFGGEPLNAAHVSERPRPCEYCGAARVFELQLLPYLMSRLDASSAQQSALDWATVLVHTCGDSCTSSADPVRTEQVIVQHDPDHALLPPTLGAVAKR